MDSWRAWVHKTMRTIASYPTSTTTSTTTTYSSTALLSLLAQANLPITRAAHALALKTTLSHHPFVASALIHSYATLAFPTSALQVLDQTPHHARDLPTWNSAISGLAKQGQHLSALQILPRLLSAGAVPNRTTLSSALSACGRLGKASLGRAIHTHVIKFGDQLCKDVSVNSALVFMYSKCAELGSAQKVFKSMPERNVVSWNSIISAHAESNNEVDAWEVFVEMLTDGCQPSEVTLTGMATVSRRIAEGRVVHGLVTKMGLAEEEITGAAIVEMYVRLESLVDARKVFDQILRTEMASWNAIILGYARNGQAREALDLFNQLRDHTSLRLNSITLGGALTACAALGAFREGKAIHNYAISHNICLDLKLATSLIDMYSKCGSVDKAREVFEGMEERDIVAWSVMISGYGANGQAGEALELFNRMVRDEGLRPDNVAFTAVLSACSHAGMLQEGWEYFNQMKRVYKLEPENEQYACVVDLLGRAGKLDEALGFIEKMPTNPDVSIWGTLLAACKIYNNVELGDYASRKLFELDTRDAGHYVLSSNLYAAAERWKDVKRVRELMKLRGIQKPPGCSWVEQEGTIHEFYAGDKSHPQTLEIYRKLDELEERMRELGYIADTSLVLHDVEDEVKQEMVIRHSERLAIGFALISMRHGEVIRVTKNLRVCVDCHGATKLISEITGRKIIVRDARRFHHFEGGECSCGDYW